MAASLSPWKEKKPVVLGIPRGGVIVASELAYGLKADLDIVLSRKVRVPDNPELALGAVSEDGKKVLHDSLIEQLEIPEDYLEGECARSSREVQANTEKIRKAVPKIPLKGRQVIITDDGLATGATMLAALLAVSAEKPQAITIAVPVSAEETLLALSEYREVDKIICQRVPSTFYALSALYIHFKPIPDYEVLDTLSRYRIQQSL